MIYVLRTADNVRALWSAIQGHWRDADPPMEVRVGVYKSTRSNEQNALLWLLLDELAMQVDWHGQRLTAAEWKDVLTAGLRKQRAVQGIDGGFVVLGERTSKMTIAQMTELIDLLHAFGAQQGVKFADESEIA